MVKLKVVVGLNRLAAGVNFNPALPCAKVMKSPLLIGVTPLFWNRVPLVMPVILKWVTSAPSAALRLMTRPEVLCVSSLVVVGVTDGVSATVLTVIVAVAKPVLRPAPALLVAPWTWKLKVVPGLNRLAAGVNFNPALPSAKVMKSPLLIGVVPLFLNSVPLVMLVILKCVTSAPSTALRVMTNPEVVCVSSLVVAFVTEGVSAIGVIVIVAVAAPGLSTVPTASVEPCTWKLPATIEFAVGVNFNPAPPSAAVMKLLLVIIVTPSFLKSVPPVMLVILKCVTSAPSTALRVMTRPEVDCVSSLVVALVTDGVSGTVPTVSTNVSLMLRATAPIDFVTVTVIVAVPL